MKKVPQPYRGNGYRHSTKQRHSRTRAEKGPLVNTAEQGAGG